MAKIYAKKAGPDIFSETIVTFRKNEDGTFTKITRSTTKDLKSGKRKKSKEKPLEEGPYVLTFDKFDADETKSYEDIDGSIKYMYFKLLELEEPLVDEVV